MQAAGAGYPQPYVISKYSTAQQINTSPIELPKTPVLSVAQELSTTTARDRAVELSAAPKQPVHEIGPSRHENTGFGFPPEKTALC
jgi:hypothetical protein